VTQPQQITAAAEISATGNSGRNQVAGTELPRYHELTVQNNEKILERKTIGRHHIIATCLNLGFSRYSSKW
jgi:hypothetical protein